MGWRGVFRARGVAAVVCAGLALSQAACNTLDATYIRDGIGTNLSPSDTEIIEVTRAQELYVGEICRQAGLKITQRGEEIYCNEVNLRPLEWTTFVQAGMNDIDRRCDAYLAWLDNKRRWREPILKELAAAAATTATIMGLTGSGVKSMAIVAAAFGFAQDTFVNFNTRLITEIDHSVVQSVVLDNQNQFRRWIADVSINNRPVAIYILRNYLRICTPFSIEMSIHNTVTVYHRTGVEGLRTPSLAVQGAGVARTIAHATAPMQRPFRAPIVHDGTLRNGSYEERLTAVDITGFQQAICSKTLDGQFTDATRSEILDFLDRKGLKDGHFKDRITAKDGIKLRRILRAGPKCS